MARIVLVHGAFAGAWCWEPVLEPLREAGHDVQPLDLPGSGADDTPPSEADLDAFARNSPDRERAVRAPSARLHLLRP